MPRGQCRLCQADADLQLSHILPAFVFRWLRESAGGNPIRNTSTPNLRVQDGLKRYWLCSLLRRVVRCFRDYVRQ